LSSNPVVTLATYSHLLTVLCSSNLEMFGNDALKQILCDRNVNQERGRPGDFVAQMTFDFETPGKRSSKLRQLQLKTFGLKVVLSACDRSIRSLVSLRVTSYRLRVWLDHALAQPKRTV